MCRFAVYLIVLIVLAGADCRPATASDVLRRELSGLAKEILSVIKDDQMQDSIAIGEFTGDPNLASNAGPGISEMLRSLLEEAQPGIVKRGSPLSLRGVFDESPDPKDKDQTIVKVTATITAKGGSKIDEKFAVIRETGTVAELLGVTVALPPKATKEKRNEEIRARIKEPEFHQTGTRISTKAGSPFAIELLVTTKDKAPRDQDGWDSIPARPVQDRDGECFVDIRRDEVFAIRLHNQALVEAAASIAIDGLDVFTFSEFRDPVTKRPRFQHFLVRPEGARTIVGWHRTNEQADSFVVTEYAKSAAGQDPRVSRGSQGMLTVTFAFAWEGDNVPDEEKGSRDGGNGTGFGPPVKSRQKTVKRSVGVVRDVISVRYTR